MKSISIKENPQVLLSDACFPPSIPSLGFSRVGVKMLINRIRTKTQQFQIPSLNKRIYQIASIVISLSDACTRAALVASDWRLLLPFSGFPLVMREEVLGRIICLCWIVKWEFLENFGLECSVTLNIYIEFGKTKWQNRIELSWLTNSAKI